MYGVFEFWYLCTTKRENNSLNSISYTTVRVKIRWQKNRFVYVRHNVILSRGIQSDLFVKKDTEVWVVLLWAMTDKRGLERVKEGQRTFFFAPWVVELLLIANSTQGIFRKQSIVRGGDLSVGGKKIHIYAYVVENRKPVSPGNYFSTDIWCFQIEYFAYQKSFSFLSEHSIFFSLFTFRSVIYWGSAINFQMIRFTYINICINALNSFSFFF